ncbi:MAG: translation initiation factor IF-3 [Myxococcota bacterium]|jgi:translation initiation factor IF-3|nr:translation initiation factor IF-3 [Myxococcota bacterium]
MAYGKKGNRRENAGRSDEPRLNGRIRAPEIRVIDPDGEQLGIMTVDDALEQAERFGLDLVEVAPNARPPVCRIMDYGKYKYQQKKRSSDARKKGARVELKEIKLRPKTDEHDFMTKLKHARRFLEKNNKVKITIMFRGREITHPEIAREMLERAAVELADVAEVEQSARMEGRNMTMMLNFSSKAKRSDDQADFDDFDDDDGDQD